MVPVGSVKVWECLGGSGTIQGPGGSRKERGGRNGGREAEDMEKGVRYGGGREGEINSDGYSLRERTPAYHLQKNSLTI